VRYQQVMVIGVRRTRQERDRLRDSEIIRVQLWLVPSRQNCKDFPATFRA